MRSVHFMFILSLALCAVTLGAQESRGTPEQVERLIAVLKADGKLEEKHAACRELALIGTEQAVPALAAILGDEKLSQPARNALENIPGPAVDEALRAALTTLKGLPLVGVLNSIGARRDGKAVEALAGLLASDDPEVVASAALSLGKIGSPEAAKALKDALPKASPGSLPSLAIGALACADSAWQRKSADEARELFDLVRAAAVPDHLRMAAMRGALIARGASGVPLMVEQLLGNDAPMAVAALCAAHEIPGPEVSKALADALTKMPAEQQVLVLHALGDRRDVAIVPPLLGFAQTAAPGLRVVAIEALSQIADPSALPKLVEWSSASDADVARAAQASVAAFPSKEADATIASLLTAADPEVRAMAIKLIGQRRVTGATPALLKAASDTNILVRSASLKVLGELAGAQEIPALLDLLAKAATPEETEALEKALIPICGRQTDRETCAGQVAACYAAVQGGAKRSALRVLRAVGGQRALDTVRTAAADTALKDEAQRMLCDWPTADALPVVAKLAKESSDAKLKILSLRGYFRLIPMQDVPAEQKLATLKDALSLVERPDEKKLALAALGEISLPEAGALIAGSLGDTAVKAEAETALLRVCQSLATTNADAAGELVAKLLESTSSESLKKRAQQLLRQLGKAAVGGDYVIGWQVSGPYAQDGKDGRALYEVEFPPEKADAKDIRWALLGPAVERGEAMMLDLGAACGAGENKAAYVRTWIVSEKEQAALFLFGTDDGNKVWLNGKLVHGNPEGGAATPGKFRADVTLKQGANALVMKVTQYTGPWEFCFRICGPDGGKLSGWKAQASPPDGAVAFQLETPKPEPAKPLVVDKDGWAELFNGKDLTGWDAAPGWWTIEDGALTSQSTPEKPCKQCNYLVWKDGTPGDFELIADFRLSTEGNSGIQIRSERRPNWDTYGYQADMTGDGNLVGFVYHHKRGLIAGRGQKVVIDATGKKTEEKLGDPEELLKSFKKGDWNTYRIVCQGPEITLYINGTMMCQFQDHDKANAASTGIIALQMHPGPPMKVEFKNIRLRELK